MNTNKKTARIAGFLYFMYFVTSIIANMFGRFVFVDAPATVNHITLDSLILKAAPELSGSPVYFSPKTNLSEEHDARPPSAH